MMWKSERGVYAPFIAIVALPVTLILLYVGLRPSIPKSVTAQVRKELEIVCQNVSHHATDFDQSIRYFQAAVDNLNIPFGDVISARLTLPTPHTVGNDPAQPCDPSTKYYNQESNFGALGLSPPVSCSLGTAGSDCIFRSSACSFNDGGPDYTSTGNTDFPNFGFFFPTSMWNDVQDVGNSAACEISVEVDTDFIGTLLGKPIVTARKVWWRPPVNYSATTGDGKNLTVLIAAQGNLTWAPINPDTDGKSICGRYMGNPDPSGDLNCNEGGNPNDWNLRVGSDIDGTYDPYPEAYSPATFGDVPAGRFQTSSAPIPYGDLPFANAEIPSIDLVNGLEVDIDWGLGADYHYAAELATRCLNPAVLTRNSFLWVLFSKIARHGLLRNNTELLFAGTMHQNRLVEELPLAGNPPVRIVAPGEDLLQPKYKPPYTFFYSGLNNTDDGNNGDSSPSFKYLGVFFDAPGESDNGDYQGFVQPFWRTGLGTNPRDGKTFKQTLFHAVMAKQLTACYHLYRNNEVKRDYAGFLRDFYNPNATFEPPEFVDNTYLNETSNSIWEQQCSQDQFGSIWLQPSCETTKGISIPELVSTMGLVEQCPVRYTDDLDQNIVDDIEDWDEENGIDCRMPFDDEASSSTDFDLRGDILAALDYIDGQRSGTYTNTNPQAVQAPGLFHLRTNFRWDTTPHTPFENPAYINDDNSNSEGPILIITHKPPLPGTETTLLRNRITSLNDPTSRAARPVTVVYMPLVQAHSNREHLCRWDYILGITNVEDCDTAVEQDSDNLLFVIGPYMDIYDTRNYEQYLDGEDPSFENYWKPFKAYYKDMLTEPPPTDVPGNIADIAETVFENLLEHEYRY